MRTEPSSPLLEWPEGPVGPDSPEGEGRHLRGTSPSPSGTNGPAGGANGTHEPADSPVSPPCPAPIGRCHDVGEKFLGFELIDVLGRGAFGTVVSRPPGVPGGPPGRAQDHPFPRRRTEAPRPVAAHEYRPDLFRSPGEIVSNCLHAFPRHDDAGERLHEPEDSEHLARDGSRLDQFADRLQDGEETPFDPSRRRGGRPGGALRPDGAWRWHARRRATIVQHPDLEVPGGPHVRPGRPLGRFPAGQRAGPRRTSGRSCTST